MALDVPDLADDRIRLRPPVPADVDAITAAVQDPAIPRFTRIPSPYTRDDAVAWVGAATTRVARAARRPASSSSGATPSTLLGGIGVHQPRRRRRTPSSATGSPPRHAARASRHARCVSSSRWAFGPLGLEQVTAWVYADNPVSPRVLEASGSVATPASRRRSRTPPARGPRTTSRSSGSTRSPAELRRGSSATRRTRRPSAASPSKRTSPAASTTSGSRRPHARRANVSPSVRMRTVGSAGTSVRVRARPSTTTACRPASGSPSSTTTVVPLGRRHLLADHEREGRADPLHRRRARRRCRGPPAGSRHVACPARAPTRRRSGTAGGLAPWRRPSASTRATPKSSGLAAWRAAERAAVISSNSARASAPRRSRRESTKISLERPKSFCTSARSRSSARVCAGSGRPSRRHSSAVMCTRLSCTVQPGTSVGVFHSGSWSARPTSAIDAQTWSRCATRVSSLVIVPPAR